MWSLCGPIYLETLSSKIRFTGHKPCPHRVGHCNALFLVISSYPSCFCSVCLLTLLTLLLILVRFCSVCSLIHEFIEFLQHVFVCLLHLLRPLLKACLHPVQPSLLVRFDLEPSSLYLHAVLSTLELFIIKSESLSPFSPPNGALSLTVTPHCSINAAQLVHAQRRIIARKVNKSQHFITLDGLHEELTSLSCDAIL